MALAYVESPADPRLDTFRFIGDSAELERRGLVVVEGRLVVDRLLAESTLRVDALLLTAAAARAMAAVLARVPASVAVSIVPQQWMQGITGFNLHRGSIAIARRPRAATVAELLAGGARRLLVLEGVGNPDNVGGLFRTARAFGVDGVVLGPGCGDPLYRKAIRVSCGGALVVPFAHDPDWPRALDIVKRHGIELVALSPNPALPSIDDVASGRSPSRGTALLLGAEGSGLTESALQAADVRARVPIAAASDSLNVTVAAAVALHVLR
jgi:tRNA G18 (ribose-2'-O)-methylase SpoU